VSVFTQGLYPKAVAFMVSKVIDVYQKLIDFVGKL